MDAPLYPKPMRSTNELQAILNQLLDCWNIIVGQNVRMIPSVERALFEFQKYYTKADLESTLNYAVYRNKRSDRPWLFRFEKFFDGDYTHFESIRAEAEQHDKARAAKKRQAQHTAGEIALSQMRHEDLPDKSQPEKRVSLDFVVNALKGVKG